MSGFQILGTDQLGSGADAVLGAADEAKRRADALQAAVDEIRTLHFCGLQQCEYCIEPWPCSTIAILDRAVSDIHARIAEVLREHRELVSQNTAWNECDQCRHDGDWAEHVASVLVDELGTQESVEVANLIPAAIEALNAAGYVVVGLPPGNADWRSVDWQPIAGWDLAAFRGQIHVDEASNEPLSPAEARQLAAALLAAADAAEKAGMK